MTAVEFAAAIIPPNELLRDFDKARTEVERSTPSLTTDPFGQGSLTLSFYARSLRRTLNAEACSIFLTRDDRPDEIELAAAFSDKDDSRFRPCRLPIVSEPGGGLTSHLAATRETVILDRRGIDEHPNRSGQVPDHLVGGQRFSMLAFSVVDRKNRLRGLVKLENKKDPSGRRGPTVTFSPSDAQLATSQMTDLLLFLEQQRVSEAVQRLSSPLLGHEGVRVGLERAAAELKRLLFAENAELATPDEGFRGLSVQLLSDVPLPIQRSPSERMPTRWATPASLIHEVWQSGEPATSNRGQTCQLAVRIDWRSTGVAVLAVDIGRRDSFDEEDLKSAALFAQYAAVVCWALRVNDQLRAIMIDLTRPMSSREFLHRILITVRNLYDLDGGIMYVADHGTRRLVCEEFITPKSLRITDPHEVRYSFEDASLASSVFRDRRPIFVSDPRSSSMINQHGRATFGIEGPVLGMPLQYNGQIVGVLVTWGHTPTSQPTQEHARWLQPFVDGAAAAIANYQTDARRRGVLGKVGEVLTRMQSGSSADDVSALLDGVREAGFDRVRLFDFHETGFVLRQAIGMREPEKLVGYTVRLDRNPYARDTVSRALIDPSPIRYTADVFGTDPDADGLQKPPGAEWAVVPLVVSNKLYGEIVADTALSSRPITAEMLDYLRFFGNLGAQTIANIQSFDFLKAIAKADPLREISDAQTPTLAIKRLLVFLSSGEGLGFNRAIYLEHDQRQSVFKYLPGMGLGAVTQEAFTAAARTATAEGMSRLMQRAGELQDAALDRALNGFQVASNDPVIRSILGEGWSYEVDILSRVVVPSWAAELCQKLESRNFLLAPLKAEDQVFGLLIVDRRWQPRVLGQVDHFGLVAAAHIAALVLRQKEFPATRTRTGEVPADEWERGHIAERSQAEQITPQPTRAELDVTCDDGFEGVRLNSRRRVHFSIQPWPGLDGEPPALFRFVISSPYCRVSWFRAQHTPGMEPAEAELAFHTAPSQGEAPVIAIVVRDEAVLFATELHFRFALETSAQAQP
jgi:GAF domain-containing protein